jgi:16S rRNA processing protein RimM
VSETSETLPLGKFGRPHGVRGELAVRLFNPDGPALEDVELPLEVEVVRGETRSPARLTAVRPTAEGLLLYLDGVDTREAAAAFTNAELWVPRRYLPALQEGEVYVQDLIGCTVVDAEGRVRGTVRASFWNGAQDVLTVDEPGGGELLVPVVDEFILEVDLEARRLVVDTHE